LPITALVGATQADDAIASALIAKKNPVIAGVVNDAEARGEARGVTRGKALAVLAVLKARGVSVPAEVEAKIRATDDDALLDAWLARAAICAAADDLFRG
jgi:hypothetical protein